MKKKTHFNKIQEAVQKDKEHAFGVLQSQCGIIANPYCQ
jgi:hypothetical protein